MATQSDMQTVTRTGLGLILAAYRDDGPAMDFLLTDRSPDELRYLALFCAVHAAVAYGKLPERDYIDGALQTAAMLYASV